MKIIKAIIAIASALAVVVTMVMPAVGAIVTTHPKNAAIPMVVITDATGDKVSLASLPAPFNTLLGVDQGPGIFAFTWTYERKQYGYAYFDVDVNGNATVTFEFSNSKQIDGDTFTATAVLLDKDGNALDQIIGRAGVNAGFGSTKVGLFHHQL